MAFYDGPVYVQNVWFNGFKEDRTYKASAISFKLHNEFSSSAVSGVSNIQFGYSDGVSIQFVIQLRIAIPKCTCILGRFRTVI